MTTKEPYSYVVLRYIHDVLTGEFVNVGLVMVVPGRPLIITRARKTLGRIKHVFQTSTAIPINAPWKPSNAG